MTTTAYDDQFGEATEKHVAIQPYDVAAILRQNVADLERELQRQRELADKAESAMASAREDLQSFIDSRDTWMVRAMAAEAELKAAREQEPVAWMLECQQLTGDTAWRLSWSKSGAGQCNRLEGESHQRALYTLPIPEPAPAVLEEWREAVTQLLSAIDSAGIINLSNGVQLGQTVWAVKMTDACDYARALLQSGGGK